MTTETYGKKRLLCEIHSVRTIKTMGMILLCVCHIVLPQRRLNPFVHRQRQWYFYKQIDLSKTEVTEGCSKLISPETRQLHKRLVAKYSTVYQLFVGF